MIEQDRNMNSRDRIDNEVLLEAGLRMMRDYGSPLEKISSPGRSMIYMKSNGETVRIRTCNDHILIVVADRLEIDAELNIEGTNQLLIVMPEIERTSGNILAYLIPTEIVTNAVRESHKKWLDSNPSTKGRNTTWNLWFNNDEFKSDGRQDKQGYFEKFKDYLLPVTVSSAEIESELSNRELGGVSSVKEEVETARQRIAFAASVSLESVKISIQYT